MTAGKEPKLLLFDLDGTLLSPKREIHPINLHTLEALIARGVKVGLATGRSPRSAARFVELLQPNVPLIHFNGALILDHRNGAIIAHRPLDRQHAVSAMLIAQARGVHVNLYLDDQICVAERGPTSFASEAKDGVDHKVVGDMISYLERAALPPTKLLLIHEPAEIPALRETLSRNLGDACALINSEPHYLEVLASGVNKGAAATALAEHLRIDLDDIVAFGDNKNDIELLDCVGCGVAMGNAHPALLSRADHQIGDNRGDAISIYLRRRFAL